MAQGRNRALRLSGSSLRPVGRGDNAEEDGGRGLDTTGVTRDHSSSSRRGDGCCASASVGGLSSLCSEQELVLPRTCISRVHGDIYCTRRIEVNLGILKDEALELGL